MKSSLKILIDEMARDHLGIINQDNLGNSIKIEKE
jgi:hypothetical protein